MGRCHFLTSGFCRLLNFVWEDDVNRSIDSIKGSFSSSGRGRASFEDYLAVSDQAAAEILARTGQDVQGYVHCILDSNVAHINRRHGPGNEKRADQLPFERSDFERIPETVASPDGIANGTEPNTLLFAKQFEDGQIVVVKVARKPNKKRKGRGKLELKTAYKKIPSVPNATENSVPLTERPKRAEAASSIKDSIVESDPGVKSNVQRI